jgi:hypothetical protein
LAVWFNVRPENVATPAIAAEVSVPPSVALPGFTGSVRVTCCVYIGSTSPNWSSAETARPKPPLTETLPGGGEVTTRCVAGAALIVIAVVVVGVSVPLDAEKA